MQRTSIRVLALWAVAVTALGALVLRILSDRGIRTQVAWVEYLAILALAAFILYLGWGVRAYQKGNKPSLDPIRAARTFLLAKSAALTGAILLGRYLAAVLATVGDLDITAQRDRAVAAAIGAGCALTLGVVGLVVERFCQLPPPSDEEPSKRLLQSAPEPLAG